MKAVARQKLALPQAGMRTRLSNLLPILSSPTDWDEIEQQYYEMVKYAAAIQSRTADTDAILPRFARAAVMPPTYTALRELDPAVNTIYPFRSFSPTAFPR